MYTVAKASLFDVHHIVNLDVKFWDEESLPEAWSEDEWFERLHYEGTYVMKFYGTPIAFITFDAIDGRTVYILKLVVHPDFRRAGIASSMIREIECELHALGFRNIRACVRDRRLDPRRRDDLSGFLTQNGFKSVEWIRQDEGASDIVTFEKEIHQCIHQPSW